MNANASESPTVVIQPTQGLSAVQLGSLWEHRELLYFLVWRDIKVRYKQAVLGILWIVLQPVASMIVFSLLFGRLLQVPSDGIPYPVFVFAGLLPWQYFAGSLSKASSSLVSNASVITKVYFPRLLIPIANAISGLVDFLISFCVLLLLMALFRMWPTPAVFTLPIFLLLAMITALGFGLWLGALNVRYRDVNYLIPFLIQIWMYLTPVIYATTLIPARYRWILALNPMTGVVEGFRWALLGSYMETSSPINVLFVCSVGIAVAVFVSGVFFFKHTEKTFADIV